MIAAVVLAAGLSRRMGQPKLLLELRGRPVIRHAVEGVSAAGFDRVLVVVPPEHAAIESALRHLDVRLVVNPAPEAGQATSIRAGVAALPPGTEAVVIALGDQPALPPRVIPALVAAWRTTGRPIVAPRYREGQGNPVLFAAAVFPELLALEGDRGARAILEKAPDGVAWVDLDLPMPADLDTPEDYERLRAPGKPV